MKQISAEARERFFNAIKLDNYKIDDTFVNMVTRLNLICDVGHKYSSIPNYFMQGYRCRVCAGNDPEQSKIDFYNQLKERGYQRKGEYQTARLPVLVICPQMHEWNAVPDSFKRGNNCNTCRLDDYEKRGKNTFLECTTKRGFRVVDEYVNNYTRVPVYCPNNHITSIMPWLFKQGGAECVTCFHEIPRQRFMDWLSAKSYTLKTVYVNINTEVIIECSNGEHQLEHTPNYFMRFHNTCKRCRRKQKFIQKIDKLGCRLLSEFVNKRKKVNILCVNKHNIWVRPRNVLYDNWGCRLCNNLESRGERIARMHLESLLQVQNLKKECVFMALLRNKRYDFAFDFNGIKYVLEIDGSQHFKRVLYFHRNEYDYYAQQHMDRLKTFVPLQNGMHVIRIHAQEKKNLKDIPVHIDNALATKRSLYLSDPSLYDYITNVRDFTSYVRYFIY
jgi:very-short-patch-repair endonuclease